MDLAEDRRAGIYESDLRLFETARAAVWDFLQVGLEEHRCRSRAWQVSQTLTGFGDAGRGSSLSEQLLQKISPQFLQWCFRLEMENSFSHSLQWLASLSFNQTWPPWRALLASLMSSIFILDSLSLEPSSSRACSWSSQIVFSWMFSSWRRWNSLFRPLICSASVLSWATVSLSLPRSFCNVCLHSLSIFKSISSCWSCLSLCSICRCRLSALLAKSNLKRLVPSSAEVRCLSASCNLHHYNQGQTQDHGEKKLRGTMAGGGREKITEGDGREDDG